MRTFRITTLGCKVNQYESRQVAELLRARGLVEARPDDRPPDLHVVNTCNVTAEAAAKSRQAVRQGAAALRAPAARVLVIGCWATGQPAQAAALPGVSAVVTHHDDVAGQIDRLLDLWLSEEPTRPADPCPLHGVNLGDPIPIEGPPEPVRDDGRMKSAGASATDFESRTSRARHPLPVKQNPTVAVGTARLPVPVGRDPAHQRAMLKVQDGCDAHCTYCIIPSLRPRVWSKPVADAVEEARRLVAAGHREVVLTGIFLGAYGRRTALRRRQGAGRAPLATLVEALCTSVPGLLRLRLSSLEPGDLDDGLLGALRSFEQVVPHFHVPLQSGSEALLRRMNRQYGREDYLRMVDRLREAFDRPALTTDVIVGFPGETDGEFARTVEVVERARFIHVHAFPFSPRAGTAAARWANGAAVRGPVVGGRIARLRELAAGHSLEFRRHFVGERVEVLVERPSAHDPPGVLHGRCERYFAVHFEATPGAAGPVAPGQAVALRVERVTPTRTFGTVVAA